MKPKKLLGVFSLAMINAAAIINLNNLPSIAILGYGLVFYLLLAAIFFFLPTAFVSAELATGWPQEGGFYTWVRIAFGPIIGFLAIWLQWIANVIWYPTLIAPIVVNLLLIFFPHIAHQPWVLFAAMQIIFWGLTFLNFRGIRSSSIISIVGVIFGTLLPAIVLIGFALIWWGKKLPIDLHFSIHTLVPSLAHFGNLSILVSVLVTLTGMEMSAVHVNNVVNPRSTYPKAVFFAVLLIICVFVLTSLAMAVLVSPQKIDIINGVAQCIESFASAMHISWLLKPIMLLLFLGVLAMASTWILGPSRGLQIAAINNEFPQFFQHKNKFEVPSRILFLQAMIFSIMSLLFVLVPQVASSYWILIALTGQLYMLMYFILFCTGLKLRLKYPQVVRAYSIPGKYNSGMWLVFILGAIGTVLAFTITFFPPTQIANLESSSYVFILAALFALFCFVPLALFSIYYSLKRRHLRNVVPESSDDILLLEATRLPIETDPLDEAIEELFEEINDAEKEGLKS